MVKASSTYICQQCGFRSSTFLGKCPQCGSWNSLVETVQEGAGKLGRKSGIQELPKIVNLALLDKQIYQRISSKISELDRVLGGGVVPGSVILLAGDPGIGKSTLLTQLALNLAGPLYIAGEESAHQIKLRADRINPQAALSVLNETDVDVISAVIAQEKPGLVVVDSIQTVETTDLQSPAGSVGQVRECAHRLQHLAKRLHIPIFLVGHVTKEGAVAGPKTLEHLVDVVLSLEGDPTSKFRVLRASKNRFGSADEVGVFEMAEAGMTEVKNPSKLFLEQKVNAPGSVVVATLTGLRPLLVEIQALVTKSFAPIPKRVGTGVDNSRLQLLVAVLSKRLGLPLYEQDVFVNVTGGLRLFEPAVDLGICMAIISSFKDQVVDYKTAFVGEVGLLGELRSVRGLEKRALEAKKLGFSHLISPQNAKSLPQAIKLALK